MLSLGYGLKLFFMYSILFSNDGPMVRIAEIKTDVDALQFAINLHRSCNVKHTIFVNDDKNTNIVTLTLDK